MKNKAIYVMFFLFGMISVGLANAGKPNTGVLPPNSTPFGKTYGVWGDEFTNWVWQFEGVNSPFFDDGSNCGEGQRGKVWFLAETFEGVVERECTIPLGKAIFFAISATISFSLEFGLDETEVRQDAKNDTDLVDVDNLIVELDGVPLKRIEFYRASSPEGGFVFSIPSGSIITDFGFESGDRFPAVTDGFWMIC